SGVFRSLDGGTTWTNVSTGVSVNNGCMDLAIRTDLPSQDWLILSCGTFAQATIYVNTDAANSTAWSAKLAETNMGRTSLAIAPSNQLIVYAAAAQQEISSNYDDGLWAVFRSADGGLTWTATVRNTNPTFLNTLLF